MGRSCPLCRCERAYVETTALRGLNDSLTTIAPLLNYDDEAHDVEEVLKRRSCRPCPLNSGLFTLCTYCCLLAWPCS